MIFTANSIDGTIIVRLAKPTYSYAELVPSARHSHLVSSAKSQQHSPAGVRFGQSLVDGSGIGGLL